MWCLKARVDSLLALLLLFVTTRWSNVFCLCPFRCLCDEESLTVWCDNAGLDVIPITLNPGLKELHLSNNRIKGNMSSVSMYENLEYLDISHNQLISLGKDNFEHQRHLKVLHVNRNLLHSLTNHTYRGLESLQNLRLDGNLLTSVPSNVFQQLHNLETLDLSQNRISSIAISAFNGLQSLKTLVVRDNRLTSIPTASFLRTPTLQTLNVGINSFRVIPGNAFYTLKALSVLILDGCGVQMIQARAFKGLESLLVLHLENNELTHVPSGALEDLPQLEELHVGQNRIKELNSQSFAGLPALRTVVLNGGGDLEHITDGAFAENPEMENVIINFNRGFHSIDGGTFQHLDHLRFVSLRGNDFATFREDLLAWTDLDAFDIRDNPLICNCSLIWLWNVLRAKNFTTVSSDVSHVLCKSPPNLHDKPLVLASVDELDCYEGTRRQILTGTVAAAGIIIVATLLLCLWHRHKHSLALEKKWKDEQETQFQRSVTPEEKYQPVRQVVRPFSKVSPITEL